MSIYGTRRDRALSDDSAWELLLQKAVDAPPPPRAPPVQDGARLRKAKPADHLLPMSLKWLRNLPPTVRPVALATKYARIINVLAHQWNDRVACDAYFASLLIDRRGARKGFTDDVRSDLEMLLDYFQRTNQVGADAASSGR